MVAPFSPRPFLICAALGWGGLISVSARAKHGLSSRLSIFQCPPCTASPLQDPSALQLSTLGVVVVLLRCSSGRKRGVIGPSENFNKYTIGEKLTRHCDARWCYFGRFYP